MIRYRKRRSAKVNPPDHEAEPGDLYTWPDGSLTRCETPSGWGMRTRGWLYSRRIEPPSGMKAIPKDGEVYWMTYKEFEERP